MGDIIENKRFRRVSARERAKREAQFRRRYGWQAEHARAMDDFDRIVAEAPAKRQRKR